MIIGSSPTRWTAFFDRHPLGDLGERMPRLPEDLNPCRFSRSITSFLAETFREQWGR